MKYFDPNELKKLYRPGKNSNGEDNGQVVIIGGSSLFHGAPILSLRAASRLVDMVFFTSPEKTLKDVSAYLKAEVASFIWVPFDEVGKYVKKADACLIGPGFMRFSKEGNSTDKSDESFKFTKEVTEKLLKKFPKKRWVIDAGSLQTIDAKDIPEGAIVTPNKREYKMLFGGMEISAAAEKYKCTIVLKGPETLVVSPKESVVVKGGNPGLTKGGTGDVQAGLTVALLTKNEPFLAASAASYLVKAAADSIYKESNVYYNAEDLANEIPRVYAKTVI